MKGVKKYNNVRHPATIFQWIFSRKGAKDANAQRRVNRFDRVRVFDPPLRLCVKNLVRPIRVQSDLRSSICSGPIRQKSQNPHETTWHDGRTRAVLAFLEHWFFF